MTDAAALQAAGEWLQAEPFLHCCTEAQLRGVVARWFAGRPGLLVARFAAWSVEGQVVWEISEAGEAPFPHVYGRVRVSGMQVEAFEFGATPPLGSLPQGEGETA